MSTPLFEVSAPISAPAAEVAPRVLRVAPGPVGPDNVGIIAAGEARAGRVVSGGPDRFDIHAGGQHLLYVDVDRDTNTIGIQGHWWYRGTYTVVPEATGSRLVHRVYNVAERLRWGVPLANRMFIGYRAHLQESVDALAKALYS
ncbi:hypothetical protein [Kutzneria buriramensis]|uniref:Polyketide cyclase/dehydrase/lipid transport protein n=1 Tax=Kutzneria buriramensis TaxID=1045776 RepID=A0A3E0HP24_9PSEU|nr:hypothetical protein [Kutzneria buriramensis]REH48263.1 hypothetical protein BCF44_105121 [Kutzneria buriramensis]